MSQPSCSRSRWRAWRGEPEGLGHDRRRNVRRLRQHSDDESGECTDENENPWPMGFRTPFGWLSEVIVRFLRFPVDVSSLICSTDEDADRSVESGRVVPVSALHIWRCHVSVLFPHVFSCTLCIACQVTCRAVGIGAYLVRLTQRVIQAENATLILTGAGALNKASSMSNSHEIMSGHRQCNYEVSCKSRMTFRNELQTVDQSSADPDNLR